jgi:RimJ/RimL family protein N-acetyltransferase
MTSQHNQDEIIYRLASADDFQALVEMYPFLDRAYRVSGYTFPEIENVGEKWLDTFRRTLGRFSIIYLAEHHDEIIGFSTARIKRVPEFLGGAMIGELRDLWIEPSVRRLGIGEKLLRLATEWCLAQDVDSIEAQYFVGNQVSDRLLQNLGFKPELVQMRMMKGEYKPEDEGSN